MTNKSYEHCLFSLCDWQERYPVEFDDSLHQMGYRRIGEDCDCGGRDGSEEVEDDGGRTFQACCKIEPFPYPLNVGDYVLLGEVKADRISLTAHIRDVVDERLTRHILLGRGHV